MSFLYSHNNELQFILNQMRATMNVYSKAPSQLQGEYLGNHVGPNPQATLLPAALMGHWLQLLLALGILCLAYHHVVGRMVLDWYTDDNASHGFIVPFITGYLIWTRRAELAAVRVVPSNAGLLLLAASAAMLVLGWLATELFTMRFSLVLALCGCALFWLGREAFKLLAFPLLFLVFMIPVPAIVYDAVAFPLKLFVSWLSVGALKMMGVMVVREGNVIMFPNITLEVVDACSGLRSLTSLITLGAAYALVMCRRTWLRLTLVACTIPIAVGTNALRVIVTGLLARHYGAAAAEGFFHEFAGLVVFALALVILAGLHQTLRRLGR